VTIVTNDDYTVSSNDNDSSDTEARVIGSGDSLSRVSCSQGCKIHRPMQIGSFAIIAIFLVIFGVLILAPESTNLLPDELFKWIGLDSVPPSFSDARYRAFW
jgi:hypothetical protein